jgi:hypothetical protein
MPIWGLWRQETFYFGIGKDSRKDRNLAANPEIVLHLESGDEVVILEGRVEAVYDPKELETYAAEYDAKYAFFARIPMMLIHGPIVSAPG